MKEILHHLGCMKPCKYWDFNYQPQLVNPRFLNHQQYLHYLHNQKSQEFPLKYGANGTPIAATEPSGAKVQGCYRNQALSCLFFTRSARSALFNCQVFGRATFPPNVLRRSQRDNTLPKTNEDLKPRKKGHGEFQEGNTPP